MRFLNLTHVMNLLLYTKGKENTQKKPKDLYVRFKSFSKAQKLISAAGIHKKMIT